MSRSAKASISAADVLGDGGIGVGNGTTTTISQSARMPLRSR
jgi:hypothetical protein